MIDLPGLAALAEELADDLALPVEPLRVGDRVLDTDAEPALMGVVNLSLDSTYRESVAVSTASAVRRGRVLTAQGAVLVDLGAESTSLDHARADSQAQTSSLLPVVEQLAADGVLVSVEAYDADVVEAALEAGAALVNLSGSRDDDAVFELAARHDAAVLLCHLSGSHARDLDDVPAERDPLPAVLEGLGTRLEAARAAGVTRLAIDPGAGFGTPWITDPVERAVWQGTVLLHTARLRRLGVPVCQSLPHAFHLFEEELRTAEGLFAVLASLGRVGVVRTHEVPRVRAVIDSLRVLSPRF